MKTYDLVGGLIILIVLGFATYGISKTLECVYDDPGCRSNHTHQPIYNGDDEQE